MDSGKGIKIKRNSNFDEQADALGELKRKGGKWYVDSREELMERGIECDEFDANAFCFVKEEEWTDSPGMLMMGRGKTSEYGRDW